MLVRLTSCTRRQASMPVARIEESSSGEIPATHLEGGEVLEVVVDGGGEPAQQQGPVRGGDGAPRGEGLGGALDRGIRLRTGGEREDPEHLLGCQVEDVDALAGAHAAGLVRAR